MVKIGININDKVQPFTEQILNGEKTVETRSKPTLRPYIGQRVGIIRTGKGKAMLVGYADVVDEVKYETAEEFASDYDRHLVSLDSPFMKDSGFGYLFDNVERIEPVPVDSLGIVSRKLNKEDKKMKFNETYKRIMEFLSGDAYGGTEYDAELGGSDWYAPGDARVPKVLGAKTKKKKKKKKKTDGDYVQPEDVPPVQRRTFPNG